MGSFTGDRRGRRSLFPGPRGAGIISTRQTALEGVISDVPSISAPRLHTQFVADCSLEYQERARGNRSGVRDHGRPDRSRHHRRGRVSRAEDQLDILVHGKRNLYQRRHFLLKGSSSPNSRSSIRKKNTFIWATPGSPPGPGVVMWRGVQLDQPGADGGIPVSYVGTNPDLGRVGRS